MSHFLIDRSHLWHRHLIELILIVGLLNILAVSEIQAQTGNSITTEFAMSASTEAGDNPCQSSVSPCGNNSQCTHTGAGKHRCVCHDGYAGDGIECAPINPCQNNNGGCDNTTDCVYTGPNQETAMDLIKNQADYSTMYSMIMAARLSELFSRPNTTVLITDNKAWDSPSLEKYYLKNDEEGRRRLNKILKNHVFPGVFDVTDLISTRNMKSYADLDVRVHLSNQGQIRLNADVNITKVNIPVKTGLCHRVDKVIVPSHLLPLVKNVCQVEIQKYQGRCVPCYLSLTSSCHRRSDTPIKKVRNCVPSGEKHPWPRYPSHRRDLRKYYGRGRPGGCVIPRNYNKHLCSMVCVRKVKKRTCCKGFYGHSCLPCPGGSSNPCSGNGECSDGDRGTGVCSCNRNFVGTACYQCANNKTFGPHCNEPCTCQFGQCDSGPEGTGKCRSETCKFPYTGENCDKELPPCESDDLCPVNAKCFLGKDGIERCHCSPGYEDDGDSCSMIDLCAEERNPCHQQATCSQEGPGVTKCSCNNGWHGDGFSCKPNQP